MTELSGRAHAPAPMRGVRTSVRLAEWEGDEMERRERMFRANDESDWIRDFQVRYSGGGWWRVEMEDSFGSQVSEYGNRTEWRGYRSERDAERQAAWLMEDAAETARANCPCGTDGTDEPEGRGNFKCGVLAPHGIHVTVYEDGCDVTDDYYINGV